MLAGRGEPFKISFAARTAASLHGDVHFRGCICAGLSRDGYHTVSYAHTSQGKAGQKVVKEVKVVKVVF
jgi:hypothetical protein